MNEITKIKNEVKLKQWAEMIRQRNESGLTVAQWCTENGVNQKTYYYRLSSSIFVTMRFCSARGGIGT